MLYRYVSGIDDDGCEKGPLESLFNVGAMKNTPGDIWQARAQVLTAHLPHKKEVSIPREAVHLLAMASNLLLGMAFNAWVSLRIFEEGFSSR